MKACLKDGPHDNRIVDVPASDTYRVPIPQPVTIESYRPGEEVMSGALFGVAVYRFTGLAYADLNGKVASLIFQYTGTE